VPVQKTIVICTKRREQQYSEKIEIRNHYRYPGKEPTTAKNGCHANCRNQSEDNNEDNVPSCFFAHMNFKAYATARYKTKVNLTELIAF
jgi:hypothetical protein